jgi:hypothetical protein
MLDLPDPKRSPSKADKLSHGPDCAIRPLIGCVIAQNGVAPGVQARNYLWSLRKATIHQTAGRDGDLSEAEYLKLWPDSADSTDSTAAAAARTGCESKATCSKVGRHDPLRKG